MVMHVQLHGHVLMYSIIHLTEKDPLILVANFGTTKTQTGLINGRYLFKGPMSWRV